MFKGIFTALITPFKEGKIDITAFYDLLEWQIEEGVHGFVVCGTTGEAPTLSYDEHRKVIELANTCVQKRVPIIAGATSNNTSYGIELANNARIADAILIAPPYYNKPTQEGVFQHYKAIADSVKRPIIVYNIPGRCLIDISNEAMHKLLALPEVVGIKDATGDLNRVLELKQEGISLFSGDDHSSCSFNILGGDGCISAASNVLPKLCAQMQNCCMVGDFERAKEIHRKLAPLYNVLFCEINPIGVKYAVSLIRENIRAEVRMPLLTASESSQKEIKQALSEISSKSCLLDQK